MYRTLSADRVIETIEKLKSRIEERFPDSKLKRVSESLLSIGSDAKAKEEWISRPIYGLRVGIITLLILGVAAIGVSLYYVDDLPQKRFYVSDVFLLIETGINDAVFLGIAIYFLFSIETRIKRKRALKAMHELRSITHVIDMHQLTKDPSIGLSQKVIVTPSSPQRDMTPFELSRYLDYCSELLSLTAKIAAVYSQRFRDSVVLSAVNDIENLTNDLNRQIWQKLIMLKDQPEGDAAPIRG